jgi:hypothetical protein
MNIQERYTPYPVAANATVEIAGSALGGFLCTTAGTITVVRNASGGNPQLTILTAHPVSAGIYYPLPFYLGTQGGTFTAAGGASGLLGVV